jgi:CHAD domain-containing protein
MREYVSLQTWTLLRHFTSQVNRTARSADADTIHDLRVAIRRLSRCLRVFSQFYPSRSWKHLRQRLAGLMQACGSVRDRDIAVGLLEAAGVSRGSTLVRRLDTERRAAESDLHQELRRWTKPGFRRQWRARLEI